MESVINLVKSMQTGEIKLLRHFYRLQSNDDKKKNVLFENVIKWKNTKDIENTKEKIIFELYGTKKMHGNTFEKLKCRLKTDILNILMLQEPSTKFKSKHQIALFDCRRLTMQGDILLERSLYKEGVALMRKASTLAQKYELYSEQLLIDNICNNYNIQQEDKNEYLQYRTQIREATHLMEKLLFAKIFYDELIAENLFRYNTKKPFEEYEIRLLKIKADYESTKSAKLGFHFNMSSLYLHRTFGNYEKSLEFAFALLKQEETEQMFKSSVFAGNIHLETSKCFLLTGQHEKAIQHATFSSSIFSTDLINILNSKEILLHCYIHLSDYKKAKELFSEVFENPFLLRDNFTKSKWHFLQAGLYYKMQDYKNAICTLKDCNELFKDKAGWMLGCTFFEAICRIESGNLEWFEYRMDGIKKLMHRYNKGQISHQNKRFALIFNILRTLNKNNYDFAQTVEDEKENIALLEDRQEGYAWNQAGCELIRFDEWIKGKAANATKNKNGKNKLVA